MEKSERSVRPQRSVRQAAGGRRGRSRSAGNDALPLTVVDGSGNIVAYAPWWIICFQASEATSLRLGGPCLFSFPSRIDRHTASRE